MPLPPAPETDTSARGDSGTPGVAQARRVDRSARLAWTLRHNDPRRALALAEAHAYEGGLAEGLLARAFARFALAAHDDALRDAGAARALFERLGNFRGLHKALNLQGLIRGDQSRLAEALELFLALHNRCREHAGVRGEADALNQRGAHVYLFGRLTERARDVPAGARARRGVRTCLCTSAQV